MANVNRTKVITGKNTRLSYFHGWEPVSINGGTEKYSVSVLIPKDDTETINAINAAVDAAIEEGIAKFGGKKPNKAAIKLPLRDGDVERDDDAYKGHYFVNANSTTAPQIVDKAVKPILDRDEVYSGCYARVSLNFYAFNSNGNRGVACGLGNIQKIRDGEYLGGRTSATDDFSTVEDDDFLQRIKQRFSVREIKTSQDIKDWNNGEIPVAVIHPASAGHGLNIQFGGSTIIWFGLTWSLELYQQTNARLWRQGQNDTVVIHHIIAKDTIDEDVMAALRKKEKIQSALIDSVKARIGGAAH